MGRDTPDRERVGRSVPVRQGERRECVVPLRFWEGEECHRCAGGVSRFRRVQDLGRRVEGRARETERATESVDEKYAELAVRVLHDTFNVSTEIGEAELNNGAQSA